MSAIIATGHPRDSDAPPHCQRRERLTENRLPLSAKFRKPLSRGARVIVRRDPDFGPGPWPDEPLGTVGTYEMVETRQGRERIYMVQFDVPQLDTDGDGPYASSQVLERYLEPVAP